MNKESRVHKSVLNAEVNLIFYFITIFLAFFSRKAFLDCLGVEFIGLVGTLGSILGYLNLAELGIVNCISFLLFKPLQSGNKQEINEIVSVLGFLYNWIGFFIFIAAIVVSLFFPIIFSATDISLGIVYFSFYSFLGSSLIGYFINYRQIVLTADQKNYLVAIYLQSATVIKIIVQLLLAYVYSNLYLWSAVEFLFGIVGCIILNWKIDKVYPWLKTEKRYGRQYLKKYPQILVNTKQIFIHKIKDFVLQKSDELFVFAFVSLKMVAFYGNYILIVTKLTSLFTSVFGSVGASIGNLIAEGDHNKIMKIFWEILTLQHVIAGVLGFFILSYLEPIIFLWLGREYILDHRILILLVIYVYISASRQAVDSFNHAYGHYADIWAAWVELIINVSITVFAGIKWGILGILLGKIVSLIVIAVIWKPVYLFTSGFKLSVFSYWKGALRNYLVSILSFWGTIFLMRFIEINPYEGLWFLCEHAFITLILFVFFEISASLLIARGGKDSFGRIASFLKINKTCL